MPPSGAHPLLTEEWAVLQVFYLKSCLFIAIVGNGNIRLMLISGLVQPMEAFGWVFFRQNFVFLTRKEMHASTCLRFFFPLKDNVCVGRDWEKSSVVRRIHHRPTMTYHHWPQKNSLKMEREKSLQDKLKSQAERYSSVNDLSSDPSLQSNRRR